MVESPRCPLYDGHPRGYLGGATISIPFVFSIQVGRAREFHDASRTWRSAIIKTAVEGPIEVTVRGITGDEQVDAIHHGGVDKAILAYSREHWPAWERDHSVSSLSAPGAFGENLTISGQTEHEVCLGDLFAVGDCRLQVSQPRQPCWKLSRRWELSELAARVQSTGRTGWYYRVTQPGTMTPRDALMLLERPHPEWTVARAHHVMHAKPRDHKAIQALAHIDALSGAWRDQLLCRV